MNPENHHFENFQAHVPEQASDMELALFFATHIDNPCEAETSPGVKQDIRSFYLREAKSQIEKMTNPGAKAFLKSKIKEYET